MDMDSLEGPWVTVNIGEQTIRALVDTGASVTVIHPGIYQNMPEEMRPPLVNKQGVKIKVANGESIRNYGQTSLEFQFEKGPTVTHQAFVCDMDIPLIIGYDFLLRFHCIIDAGQNKFHVVTNSLGTKKDKKECKAGEVRASQTEIIPAGAECCITAIWMGEKDSFQEPLLLEGDKSLAATKGLWVGKGLIDPSDKIPVRVVNASNQDLRVVEGTRLGFCFEVEEVREIEQEDENFEMAAQDHASEDFEKLIKNSKEGLDLTQGKIVEELLKSNGGAFIKGKTDLGRTGIHKHRIETGNAAPICLPPRRFPIKKREAARAEIERMQEMGVIRPSNSPWRAAVVLVEKKDGGIRICLDYRGLNAVTRKDKFPIPRTDDTLASLGGSQWYSTLDLASSYWQVEMDPRDAEKTAFGTEDGLWEFNVLPMGLCNAGATFQRLMQLIFRGMDWRTLLIYLDDLIIHSRSFDQHVQDVQEVLKRLQTAGLKLTPKKCHLFKHEVEFLGHVVNAEGIQVDPKKTEAIRAWPIPKTVTEVRAFLGTASYYRKHILGFAHIAGPLHNLTKKKVPFSWTQECQIAMDTLKEALSSAPILAYPREELEFIVDADCSQTAAGGVLSQEQDGVERPILYFSQALSKEERNYCTTRRELLAIVKMIKHCRHYLLGARFKVRTDHGSLRWLMQFKNPEGQIARWLEVLGQYSFEIEHRPGVKHGNADGLSRRPCPQNCSHCGRNEEKERQAHIRALTTQKQVIPPVTIWEIPNSEIAEMQENDTDLREARRGVQSGEKPEWKAVKGKSLEARVYWQIWGQLKLEDGILVRESLPTDGPNGRRRVVAPNSIRREVFDYLHGSKWGGHQGIARTVDSVKQRFWWPNMKKDLVRWCQTCEPCQRRKLHQHARSPLTQDHVGAPLERIACDILSFTTQSTRGNTCALVVSDYFSKWAKVIPLADHRAEMVATALVLEVFLPFGTPKVIHTDQGREFQSELLAHLYRIMEIKRTRTSPYRPQSDGLVERLNRTMLEMLSKFCAENTAAWDEMVPYVVSAYNSSKHSSTGLSPNLLFLGREITLPVDIIYGTEPLPPNARCLVDYVEKIREAMKNSFEFARDKLTSAAERQKKGYDKTAHVREFEPGSWVLRYYPPLKHKDKLNARYVGPYLILRKTVTGVYEIQRSKWGPIIAVHIDHLKPFESDSPPQSWLGDVENPQETEGATGWDQQEQRVGDRQGRIRKPPRHLADYVP